MSQNPFFAPTLGKEFCQYFLYLTIAAFIFLVLTLIDAGYAIIKGEIPIITGILSLLGPLLLYLNNRILYSMCFNSLA